VVASGFSQRIGRPASNSGSSTWRWVLLGLATITASTRPLRARAALSAKVVAFSAPAPSALRAQPSDRSTGSARAVTTAPGVTARLLMCSTPIIPVPTNP
jgi:hypothetical protein